MFVTPNYVDADGRAIRRAPRWWDRFLGFTPRYAIPEPAQPLPAEPADPADCEPDCAGECGAVLHMKR